MHTRPAFIVSTVLSAVTLAAHAQPHGGDIVLSIHADRIATNTVDEDGSVSPHRVFESEFGALDFTDEPGFDSDSGVFPPLSQIGFSIRRALRLWNGSAFPADPTGIPAERIRIRKSGFGDVLTPTTDTLTPGFAIDVSSSGEFHQHLGYTLQSPNAPGIYLLELELWSSAPAILTSDPFWIVFNNDLSEDDHALALEWTLNNLIGSRCPADVNADTLADILDFLDYLDAFSACENLSAPCAGPGGIPADFNGDTLIDILDLLDFLDAFGQACP